jgi:hypothetical protein
LSIRVLAIIGTLENVLVVCQHICYHKGVKSEEASGDTGPFPQTFLNQRGPAWSASNIGKYTGRTRAGQCPTRPIMSHALNIALPPSHFLRSRCSHQFVPGHIPGSDRAVQPGTSGVLRVFRAW